LLLLISILARRVAAERPWLIGRRRQGFSFSIRRSPGKYKIEKFVAFLANVA
jgi:hypothetical protein